MKKEIKFKTAPFAYFFKIFTCPVLQLINHNKPILINMISKEFLCVDNIMPKSKYCLLAKDKFSKKYLVEENKKISWFI